MELVPDSYYYKKDLGSLTRTVEVSTTVVYYPKPTLFGPSVPSFPALLKFLGLQPYTQGFYNYNGLGFTTQVPARVTYLVPYDLEITYDYFKTVYPTKVVTPEFLSNFTVLEYMVFDCLCIYPNLGDGYFETARQLTHGMIQKFQQLKNQYPQDLDWPKILRLALAVNPKIKGNFTRNSIRG
jgi:hypothetical protein